MIEKVIFVMNRFCDSHVCPMRITATIEYITANILKVFADNKKINDKINKHCNNSIYIFLIFKRPFPRFITYLI